MSTLFNYRKIGLPVKIQIIGWSIYWVLLLLLNLFYFKSDNYPKPLLVIWVVLFTLCGIVIFYLLTLIGNWLIQFKVKNTVLILSLITLSIAGAYIWSVCEPIISWVINPAINDLEIKWDLGSRGTFTQSFIVAFFVVAFYLSKKIEQLILQQIQDNNSTHKGGFAKDTVSVYSKNEIFLLPIINIKKISIEGNHSVLTDHENSSYEIKKTLKKWEAELPNASFIRIHRSTIINMRFIEKIEHWHNYTYRVTERH